MSGNTVYVQGSYVDVHDNEVVNLSIDKATLMLNDKPKVHGEADVCPPLRSEDAMRLWAIAKEHGWVDDDLQPRVSMNKAAILASVMADVLGLSPRWKAFEELWGVKDLPNCLCKAQLSKYYADELKRMAGAMESEK